MRDKQVSPPSDEGTSTGAVQDTGQEDIKTVSADDTPYTSATSFDDLPLSEDLRKAGQISLLQPAMYRLSAPVVEPIFTRPGIWASEQMLSYRAFIPR